MLDSRYVAENLDTVTAALASRGYRDEAALARIGELAASRRTILVELETLRAKRNDVSKSLASADKQSPAFQAAREEMRVVGDKVKALEESITKTEGELEGLMLLLPNIPHPSTPVGASEADNKVLRVWGDKPTYNFTVKPHDEIGVDLNILDFERGTKISGARFTVLRAGAARLERALMQFMLDLHSNEHGYTEIWPPVLMKDSAMLGTGQLPKFKQDSFQSAMDWDEKGETQGFEWYLAPTAEVPVTNLHADEILDGASLPIAYTAYTPCFRSEAGSYGKDTKGLIRQHQFDKVELVRFCRPEDGEAQLELLTSHAEEVLKRLKLHHRVVALCTGDMGGGSQKTYDIEVWLPAQNAYREISSCSWFGEYQARRAKIRYRAEPKGKPQLANTLNGSALAIGRTLVAILEQYQQADGTVLVPDALVPYMSGVTRITKA